MVRFSNIEFFWFFAGFVLIVFFFISASRKRKKDILAFGGANLAEKMLIGYVPRIRKLKEVLLLSALFVLLLALTGPQVGTKITEVKRKGIDIMIAIDVSTSMNAEDISPSRLGRAKYEASKFIERLKGDRVGLVAFAGISYLHCPLTLDYSASKLFLDAIDTGIIGTQGTAIADAILLCLKSFKSDVKKHKVIIVISDGEDHEGDLSKAIDKAIEDGVIIYSVGVGTLSGSPIPVINKKTGVVEFKRDRGNRVVTSSLEEESLQKIAAMTGGEYYSMEMIPDVFPRIYKSITGLEEKEFSTHEYSDYREQFQIFLVIGLILLLLEILLPEKIYKKNGENG